ncbi:hypothetical protein ACWCQW_49905 [Streptomyces mirabilis]
MVLVVVFGAALLVALLLSGPATRTVLSTSVLFLLGGALFSDGFLGLNHSGPKARAAAGPTAGSADVSGSAIALELVLGPAFGVLPPLGVDGLARFRLLGAEPKPQPLLPPATGTIPYATCHLAHANPYPAVVLAIFLVFPALLLSLLGTRIARKERSVAAWSGPKGFASVAYGLLVLQSGIPQDEEAFTLVAVCIAFSIIAHGSTDVPQPLGGTGET